MKQKHGPIYRSPILPDRIRQIDGGFCFIPHRFLRDGFFASLCSNELLLYVLLVLVSDRHGISFYGCDSICSLLGVDLDAYVEARNALIEKDLIAFDGTRFQVLSLPERPVRPEPIGPLFTQQDFERQDPATIRQLIHDSLRLNPTLRLMDQRAKENL